MALNKHCKRCDTDKSVEDFSKDSSTQDGLAFYCRSCRADYTARRKENNPDYNREYYLANVEKFSEYGKRYRQENRSKVNAVNMANKARRRGVEVDHVPNIRDLVISLHGDVCLYPGCERSDIELDHVIPISQGGAHAVDNLQPLCKTHNMRKHARYADFRSPTRELDDATYARLSNNNKILDLAKMGGN